MKQYLLFLGENYYPYGGWKDFHGEFDSVKEAKQFVADNPTFEDNGHRAKMSWAQIVDTTINKIVSVYKWRWNESKLHNEPGWKEE